MDSNDQLFYPPLAKTVWNATAALQGHFRNSTTLGYRRASARLLAQRMKEFEFTSLYCSGFETRPITPRARQRRQSVDRPRIDRRARALRECASAIWGC